MTVTKIHSLLIGDELERKQYEPISRVQLAKYAGASGDYNPLHLDDDFAKKIGMEKAIAHGMLIMGILGEYVMEIVKDEAFVSNFKMRFGKMTFPGDTIHCVGKVKDMFLLNEKQHIVLKVTAIKNETEVVGSGSATLIL